MIHLVAESLKQAGVEFTVRELDDILWLASMLTGAPDDTSAQSAAAAPSIDENMPDEDIALPNPTPVDHRHRAAAMPDSVDGVQMYANGGMPGSISACVLPVPGVAGSPGPGELRHALQPFTRRVPSRRAAVLDEEATANGAAESGVWTPVFRPLRERCFKLSLVIEDCTSATLRARALSELATHLRQQGGLRSVDIYRLAGSGEARLTTDSGTDIGVARLAGDDRLHLVLFATDGTSARWRDGVAPGFLHAVGARCAVSILHLLPRETWAHTLVGEPDLLLHTGQAGEANRRLRYELPHWIDAEEADACLPVPVIGMDTASIARWARTMSARGGAGIPGVLVAPVIGLPAPMSAPAGQANPALASDPGPAERVARYRQMASQAAFDLAVFFSTMDAMTIPIMRLVQRTMSPNSGDGELAEFILGGLVVPKPLASAGSEQIYRFRDGVAAELFRALRYSEEHRIRRQLLQVGQFLQTNADEAAPFAGAFPAPDGQATITEWALPFAEVSRDMLQRLSATAMPAAPGLGTAPPTLPDRPAPHPEPLPPRPVDPEGEGFKPGIFVGRRQELLRLSSFIRHPSEAFDHPFRARIGGQARIGKTALALVFATTAWSDDKGQPLPYLHVSTQYLHEHPKGILHALPVAPQYRGFPDALAAHLQGTSTLLILDDVNGPTQLQTVRQLIAALPACPILCVGRASGQEQPFDESSYLSMPRIELRGLNRDDSLALLAARSPAATADGNAMSRVADALFGMPAALAVAASHLASESRTARLLRWIGMSDKPLRPARLPDDAVLFRNLTHFMQDALIPEYTHWQDSRIRPRQWQFAPALLAHGPLAGYPVSLAAAVLGLKTDDGDPSYSQELVEFLDRAGAVGLRITGERVWMVPLWAMCLRAASADQGPVVMDRCGRWYAERLARFHERGENDWDELDRAQPALLEWLKVCTPEAGSLVRDVCVDYARNRGPLHQWQAFCRRMLSLLAADDADRPAWKRVSDRLAYGESGQYSLEDMPDTVRRVGVPAGTTQDVAPTMVLLPHQERIAVLALKATEDLRGRTKKQLRHAGIVLQALGTGMTMSLLGYFRLNSELPERRRTRRHVVIVDRLELGKQIVDSYRRFVRPAEPPIVMLATAAELNTELAGDAPIVIVTTTQKLQQLTGINAECIIFFGLRSVTPALMARFKSGTTLIFSYEAALVESRFVRDYGPLVASYAFGDAVEEGNLVPVALRRENVGILPGPVQLNMVRKIVSIIAGRTRRANAKAVVIVEDAASAALLRDAIQHAKVKHCALAAGSMAPARLRQTIVEFNRLEGEAAVLVTTPSIAVGLYLNGIDVCYLTTRVPTAAMFRLESFVSRIRPGKRHGEIVDMADNDWASVDEARRIVRGYPYGLS